MQIHSEMVINTLSSKVDKVPPSKLSKTQGARDDLNVHPQPLQLKVATKGISLFSYYCLYISKLSTIIHLVNALCYPSKAESY